MSAIDASSWLWIDVHDLLSLTQRPRSYMLASRAMLSSAKMGGGAERRISQARADDGRGDIDRYRHRRRSRDPRVDRQPAPVGGAASEPVGFGGRISRDRPAG